MSKLTLAEKKARLGDQNSPATGKRAINRMVVSPKSNHFMLISLLERPTTSKDQTNSF